MLGQVLLAAAVGIGDVDFPVAVAVGGEDDLAGVGQFLAQLGLLGLSLILARGRGAWRGSPETSIQAGLT